VDRPRADPTYWALLAAFAAVVAAAGVEAWLGASGAVTPAMWAGRGLVLAGGAFTVYARRALGASYAPTAHHPDPDQALVRGGPYRRLRHPQYLGNLTSVVGLLLALDARWSWLTLLPFAAAQRWRVAAEERFLRARFGARYDAPEGAPGPSG